MSKTAIVAGPDPDGLGNALASEGFSITQIEDVVSSSTLEAAGIDAAAMLVLTDVGEASGIPVAKELNPDVRVVVYSEQSLPEVATRQTDLAVDPALLDVSVVAEELAAD
ncbi:DUF7126 family protein [Halonotius roseus]|uniref:CTP synthetase n=1 Tax=Halonotius roseus TaxID=2511997 RepID=A0A544QNQ7_9EURY|nr:CTP synthetase [Halonotius roseus]TQQ80556.1 CTP synthetase [Halonotius roseus]